MAAWGTEADDEGRAVAHAEGTVTNEASGPVEVEAVAVSFPGDPPVVVRAVPSPAVLEPGQTGAWEARAVVAEGTDDGAPPSTSVSARWSADEGSACAPPEVDPEPST